MEIFLYSRPGVERPPQELERLIGLLDKHLPGYRVHAGFAGTTLAAAGIALPAEKLFETLPAGGEGAVALAFGGDGTFLDCVRMAAGGMPVVGINSGRLGFLANVPLEGMEQALQDLAAGRFTTERRALIDASGNFGQQIDNPFVFNEFSLQRGGGSMIAVETYVDGEMVATYWGDGVMVSTPAGSTAYSLSVGGPVVAPGCECFVISPIAPHNLTMRPVVIPDRSQVTMKVRARSEKPYATLDNRTFTVEDGAVFQLKKAKKSAILIKPHTISFYDTLRKKMLWGIDNREM